MNFDTSYFWGLIVTPPPALLYAVWITVSVTLVSMLVGVVVGLALALFGLSRFAGLRQTNALYVWFFRGTPVLAQLFLVYFGLPSLCGVDLFPTSIETPLVSLSGSVLAAIIVFSLHEAAYMSEIVRSGIESVDRGQYEAAQALGMTSALAMRRIILPQAVRVIVPPLGNQTNIMFKTTAFLSVLAVPELVHVANALISDTYKTFETYLAIAVYYLMLTGVWSLLQHLVERRLQHRDAVASKPLAELALTLSAES